MPFNGNGVFNRLYNWAADAAQGIKILSARMDGEFNGVAAGLSNCVTRDGQSPPSANLPMGGKQLTNLGTPTTSDMAGTKGYIDTLLANYLPLAGGVLSGGLTGTSFTVGTGADTVARGYVAQNQSGFLSILVGAAAASGSTISYSWASGGQGPLIFANSVGEVGRFGASGGFNVAGAITQAGNQVWHSGNLNAAALNGIYGFTPYSSGNPSGYITGITSAMITTALGYTPAAALGFTPANKAGDTFTGGVTVQGRLARDTGLYLDVSGSVATLSFDSNSSLAYDRTAKKLTFTLNGTAVASIDAAGNLRVTGNVLAAQASV